MKKYGNILYPTTVEEAISDPLACPKEILMTPRDSKLL